jgi:hypothetical protein
LAIAASKGESFPALCRFPQRLASTSAPENWPIEPFLVALRNCVAHGDARKVFPDQQKRQLLGFRFKCTVGFSPTEDEPALNGKIKQSLTWEGEINLRGEDMRRIGRALAHEFCSVISGDNKYFEHDAESIVEPPRAA